MSKNTTGKCPFCGIADVKGIYHSKREAYDHFLPKAIYPFNSINFQNLAPACHECNSSYKLSRDPLYHAKNPLSQNAGNRRKAFYPYQSKGYAIKFEISLNCLDWTNIQPADITFETGPDELREELDTWLDVYGIEERYQAKCSADNDGKYWIEQVWDECRNYEKTPEQIIESRAKLAISRPFADVNFLRSPFLQACYHSGLFGCN